MDLFEIKVITTSIESLMDDQEVLKHYLESVLKINKITFSELVVEIAGYKPITAFHLEINKDIYNV